MSTLKAIGLAMALTAGVAATSLAQDAVPGIGNMYDLHAMVFAQDGKMRSGKLTGGGLTQAMKTARPISGDAVIFRSEGRLYVMEDPRGTAYQQWRDMMGPITGSP